MSGHPLLRLALSALCGMIVGITVEMRRRPGGTRTHMFTTLGSTLFCLTAARGAAFSGDALRAIQAIAPGVGFIGAAAVLRHRAYVQGVATAASIWVSAAIGCGIGFGYFVGALPAAVFVAIVNCVSFVLWRRRRRRRRERRPPDGR